MGIFSDLLGELGGGFSRGASAGMIRGYQGQQALEDQINAFKSLNPLQQQAHIELATKMLPLEILKARAAAEGKDPLGSLIAEHLARSLRGEASPAEAPPAVAPPAPVGPFKLSPEFEGKFPVGPEPGGTAAYPGLSAVLGPILSQLPEGVSLKTGPFRLAPPAAKGPEYFTDTVTGRRMVVPTPGATAAEVPGQVSTKPPPKAPPQVNSPEAVMNELYPGKAWGDLSQAEIKAVNLESNKRAMAVASAAGAGRAAAWADVRTVNMLDTAQGNKPVTITVRQLSENPDRYISAGAGVPALSKATLLEDIRGSIGRTRESLGNLTREFSPAQASQIAVIMGRGDPGAIQAFFQSGVGQTLTPEQQDYLINLFQLREQAMAMRSVLGAGQGSDELRAAILRTVPSAATPSRQYASKQLDAFEATLDRLSRGIPNVPLRPMPTRPAAGAKRDQAGGKYQDLSDDELLRRLQK